MSIPIDVYRDYLVVVRGSIGELEKRNLIIDTGAYPSVVTPELAKKLHLDGKVEELRVMSHNIQSEVVYVPSLQFGPVHAEHLRVIVRDLTELDRKLGIRVDALVGLDVLFPNSFRIDYRDRKMIFGPVAPLPLAVPIRWRSSTACIDVNVNGRPLHLLLDTGAADITLFGPRIPELNNVSGVNIASTNLGGEFTLRQIKLTGLEAGGTDLGSRDVYLSTAQNMEPYPYDGLMAAGTQRFRQIAFDFQQQEFSWEPLRPKRFTLMAAHDSEKSATPPSLALPKEMGMDRPSDICQVNGSAEDGACTTPTLNRAGSTIR